MEKIHSAVIASVLLIFFSINIRGNNGKTIQHNGSIYIFRVDFTRKPDWEESRQYCRDAGSDLVSIESHNELKFVNDTILEMKATEYFIGLRKDDESKEWRWLSGNSNIDPFPWAKGEPSNDGKCVVMYNFKDYYGQYNDLRCDSIGRPGYICESPAENNNEEVPTVKETTSQTEGGNKEPTTTQSLAVTSTTRSTLPETSSPKVNSKAPAVEGPTSQTKNQSTESATKPTIKRSTMPRSLLTGANSQATTARDTVRDLPTEKNGTNNSNMIVIVLTLLAILILIILIIFCVISVRRRRNFKKQVKSRVRCTYEKPSSSGQQSDEHSVTVHVTLSRTETGLDTYETVNDCKEERTYANVKKTSRMSMPERGESLELVNSPSSTAPVSRGLDTFETVDDCKKEHTYAAVKNTNRTSRPDRGESFTRKEEAENQTRPEDGNGFPLEDSPELDAIKKFETFGVVDVRNEKQEENKDHVYAVVHRDGRGKVSGASFHAKAARNSLKDDTSLEPANRSSSVEPVSCLSSVQSVDRSSCVNPVDRSSSAIETGLNTNEATPNEDALAGDEKKDYLYAVVDKTNKKKRPPQKPSPYRGLVYADLSHSPANNTKPVKKGFPTIYADIDYLKTDAASLKLPEENLDQETENDGLKE